MKINGLKKLTTDVLIIGGGTESSRMLRLL